MAADTPRVRRPAVWPWLVMPIIVLLVFCALYRIHQRHDSVPAIPPAPTADAAGSDTPQQ